jgi:hypothetical protein
VGDIDTDEETDNDIAIDDRIGKMVGFENETRAWA